MRGQYDHTGSALGSIVAAIAVIGGIGWLGAKAFDWHGHTCPNPSCQHRWSHLGAFNTGDVKAHTCTRCGTEQWWKDGHGPLLPTGGL